MKLVPRNRAKAALYEMDTSSNYLLMFKNKDNAHMYTGKGIVIQPKAAKLAAKKAKAKKAAAAKKAASPKVKKVSAVKPATNAGKPPRAGKATSANKMTLSLANVILPPPPPPPLTKQQSQNAITLARQGSQTHRWEFVNDSNGWSKYTGEATKLVEMEYQSWQQQPSVFVRSVRSGDWHYSVNFNTMEQTNLNHPNHRVRKIRRVANF